MSDSEGSYAGEDDNEDFEEKFSELKLQWKNALKKAKKLLLKCPNFERCQFKCGSVGGMQYHYVRCTGKSPQFKCDLCSRSYESKTGLNYHVASSHGTPVEELKAEPSGRPQRSTALSTMTAIILANNPPPIKQTMRKSTSKNSAKGSSNTPSPLRASESMNIDEEATNGDKNDAKGAVKAESKAKGKRNKLKSENGQLSGIKDAKLSNSGTDGSDIEEEEEEEEGTGEEEEEGEENNEDEEEKDGSSEEEDEQNKMDENRTTKKTKLKEGGESGKTEGRGEGKKKKGRRGTKDKKGGKAVNIPSIEYPDEYKYFLPNWRQEMKDNKVIKCPNYKECEFKCTTVNGMKYHYVRCNKSNPPEFKCEVCSKKFQCRTGLVWHLKKTHNLVDMHPSKGGGGFLGIITKDSSGAVVDPGSTTAEGVVSRKRRGFGSRRGVKRRRHRKCVYPRRTAAEVLQNIMNIELLPEPKLGPVSCRSNLPSSEYVVADNVPTDTDHKPSAIITLGEEALEWQQMSSDELDSEYDYDDDGLSDGEVVERWVGVGEGFGKKVAVDVEEEEEAVIGSSYSKSSSSSDSDEDYTVPYQRKRGGGSGRGRGRRGRGGGGSSGADSRSSGLSPATTRPVGRPRLTPSSESSASAKNSPSTAIPAPPSLVSPQARPPTLIKAEPSYSRDQPVLAPPKANTPNIVTKVGVVQGGDRSIQREPPPLIKKPEEPGAMGQPKLVSGGGGSRQPRFILPSPSSLGVGGESLAPGGNLSSTPPPPVKRRPGRPRKDQSVALSTNHTQRTSRVHHLGHGRGGGGRGRGSRGGPIVGLASNTPAASGKLKVTQYEFQEQRHQQQQQSLVSAGQGLYLTTTSNHTPSPSASTPTQFQPLILQPGTNTALQPNIVTPLQIVSAGQGALPAPLVQNIPTVPHGNVIYLQSPVQQQEQSPQYISKDGQLFQILTPTSTTTIGDGTKKLNVIMQPTAANAQPTFVQASDIGNLQYITQLDGLPPPHSTSSSASSSSPPTSSSTSSSFNLNSTSGNNGESLNKKFERVRQRMTIMQLDGPQPPSETASTANTTTTTSTTTITSATASVGHGESSSRPDPAPSSLLQAYFEKVQHISAATSVGKTSDVTSSAVSGGHTGKQSNTLSRALHVSSDDCPGKKVSTHSKRGRAQRGQLKRGKSSRLREAVDGEGISSVKKMRRSVSPTTPLSLETEGLTLPAAAAQGCETGESDISGGMDVSGSHIADNASADAPVHSPGTLGPSPGTLPKALGHSPAPGTAMEVSTSSPEAEVAVKSKADLKFECLKCGMKYQTRAGVKYHMVVQHELEDLKPEDSLAKCQQSWRKVMKYKSVFCHICKIYSARSVSSMVYHWKTCGKSQVQVFKCEVCGKEYNSIGGYRYHVATVHRPTPPQSDSPEEEPAQPGYVPPRKAAMAASSRMADVVKTILKQNEDSVAVPRVDYISLAEQLKTSLQVQCPMKGCDKTFRSVSGVRYHIQHTHTDKESVAEKTASDEVDESSMATEEDRVKEVEMKDTVMTERENFIGQDAKACLRNTGQVVCPKGCGKKFCSYNGLKYHVSKCRSSRSSSESPLSTTEEVVKEKEHTHVTEKTVSVEVDESSMATKEDRVMEVKIKDTVAARHKDRSDIDEASLKACLKKSGTVACPKDCSKTFRSYNGLMYHLDKCHSNRKSQKNVASSVAGMVVDKTNAGAGLSVTELRQVQSTGQSVCPWKDGVKEDGNSQVSIAACSSSEEEEEFVPSGSEEEQEMLDNSLSTGRAKKPREKSSSGKDNSKTPSWRSVDLKKLKAQLKNEGMVVCPFPGCVKSYKYICSLREHYRKIHLIAMDLNVSSEEGEEDIDEQWMNLNFLKDQLLKHGRLSCPKKGCGKVLGTPVGMKYHLERYHINEKERRKTRMKRYLVHSHKKAENKTLKKSNKIAVNASFHPSADGKCPNSTTKSWSLGSVGWSSVKRKFGYGGVAGDSDDDDGSVDSLDSLSTRTSGIVQVNRKMIQSKFREACNVKCPVEGCNNWYGTPGGLEYHLRTLHPARSPQKPKFQCSHCDEVLGSKKRVEHHLINTHQISHITQETIHEMEYYSPSDDEGSLSGSDVEDKPKKQLRSSSPLEYTTSYRRYAQDLEEYITESWLGDKEKSLLSRSEWRPQIEEWPALVEYSSFLPSQSTSMEYRLDLGDCDSPLGNEHSLNLFQASPMDGFLGFVFFTGGPVWAMDWLPTVASDCQVLALSAYRDLDETHGLSGAEHCHTSIQLWNLGPLLRHKKSSQQLPSIAAVLAVDYGPVRDLQWYRGGSECWDLVKEDGVSNLLAVACGDGCVRIIAIPDVLMSSVSEGRPPVLQPTHLAAVLLPVGHGVNKWEEFGQCLCLDWSPGTTNKLAAGYSNGTVCVWDLESKLFQSSGDSLHPTQLGSVPAYRSVFHPIVHLSTNQGSPCRCVGWCPSNTNYIFTGGVDRRDRVWDIRQPFNPVDVQERHHMTVCAEWLRPWSHCYTSRENLDYNRIRKINQGIRHFLGQDKNEMNIQSDKGPSSDCSYSMWTDRLAYTTFAGELVTIALPTTFHGKSPSFFKIRTFSNHLQRLIFGGHLEHLEDDEDDLERVADMDFHEPTTLSQTQRLVLTPHWKKVAQSPYKLSMNGSLLAAFTQVCWSSNKTSKEWLVVGSNSGLACLLFVPLASSKPISC